MKKLFTTCASLLLAAPLAAVITLSSAGAAFACEPGWVQGTAGNGAPICVPNNSGGVGGGGNVSSGGDGKGTPSSGYVPPVQAAPVAPVAPPAYVPPAYVPPAAPQPVTRAPAPAPVYAPPVSNSQVQPNTYEYVAPAAPAAPNTQISTNETINDAVAETTAVSEAANDEVKDTSVSEASVSADASSPSPSASNEAKKVTKIDNDKVSSSESEEEKSLSAFAILWIFIVGGAVAAIGGAIYQVCKMNKAAKDETVIEKEPVDS